MRLLTLKRFELARDFVADHARPVDRALLAHFFDQEQAGEVWEPLTEYQNRDGGFGNALEPDFRLPDSSPLATTIAFQYFTATGASSENESVAAGIRYLVSEYDRTVRAWHSVPPQVNDFPRAEWWNYDRAHAEEYMRTRWANPSAEIVGYLNAFAELVPKPLLDEATEKALVVLQSRSKEIEGHDFLCYTRMAPHLPRPRGEEVWKKLKLIAPSAIATDRAAWNSYSIRPLWAAPSPSSQLSGVLGRALEENLDFEIDAQQPDGSWHPFWSWHQYEDNWKTAHMEWQGQLTVKLLISLLQYGRIAGITKNR